MRKNRRHILLLCAASGLCLGVVLIAVLTTVPGLRSKVAHVVLGNETSTLDVRPGRKEFPVKGLDLSHHNGPIDFGRVAADSVDFVILKATEGVDYTDSCLVRNWRGATGAGLMTGFYHFFRFDRGGVRQGRHFLDAIDTLSTQMPLVIDFEQTGNRDDISYYQVVGRLRDMAQYLQRCGHRVMIYCNHREYDRYIRGNFDDLDLWLASGRLPEDNDRRHLWQHSHNGRVAGIATPVDINTFNGSRAEFLAWINRPAPVYAPCHGVPDSTAVRTVPASPDSIVRDTMPHRTVPMPDNLATTPPHVRHSGPAH